MSRIRTGACAVAATLVVLPIHATAWAVAPDRPLRQAAPAVQVLDTGDGYPVRIQVWPPYPSGSTAQSVIGVLNGLSHDSEMGSLHVSVRTPADVEALCGSDALACYSDDTITLPGEQSPGAPPVAFLLAHEYAHHILQHRRNDPWPAGLWGPKRWASGLNVCRKVHQHQLLLGYSSIPSEAYAETFAMMRYPELHLPWYFTDLLAPDDAIEAAARADVVYPWRGPSTRTYRGRLPAGASRRVRVATPLDGSARFSTSGRADVVLELLAGRRVLARARPHGRTTRLNFTICGQRRLTLRLTAVRGGGRYALTVSRP